MGAADDQAEEGWFQVRASEHRGIDVSPEVVHPSERTRPGCRQPFRDADADQQAARQAWAPSDCEEINVARADTGALEGHVEEVREAFEVVSGGELGHHATELGVEVDLRVDDVG
jgi:hypothetical protein